MTAAASGAAEADRGKRPVSTNLGSHPLTGDDVTLAPLTITCPAFRTWEQARGEGGDVNGRGTVPDPEFWTVAETSSLLRVCKMTVYRMIRSGELESVRIGRSFRIPGHAVRKYAGSGPPGTACPPETAAPAIPARTARPWLTAVDSTALTSLRQARGLSKGQLAQHAGISTTTVRRLEGGQDPTCHIRTATRLAAALGQPPAALTRPVVTPLPSPPWSSHATP